ncbi:MAG: cytochrome c [Roseivirga sp.]|nr:cytochrome c [Roseivirga sp.]
MDIRPMIHRVRALITIALVLSFGLMSFTFINYEKLEEMADQNEAFYCGVIDMSETIHQKEAELLPGYKLFQDWGCKTCHAIDRKVVGPALANVRDRRSDDWLKAFIRNSSALIGTDDETAVKIYNEYNQLQMPAHDLTDAEILSILDYITKASGND